MTWHLKDRELERKLIELCPNFLSELDLAVYLRNDDKDHIVVAVTRKNIILSQRMTFSIFG